MTLTAQEQYRIELLNRARLDPVAEAERYGIDLNKGMTPGTITDAAKQVLAPNTSLNQSATLHSQWMLENDIFSHTGALGSSSTDRIGAAGYDLSTSWATGENIAAHSMSNLDEATAMIEAHHAGLMESDGHRANIMSEGFREAGVSQEFGQFVFPGGSTEYLTSMLTTNYGRSGNDFFLTGVSYTDSDNDDFYTVGEAVAGVTFTVGADTANTVAAGGYSLGIALSSSLVVNVAQGGTSGTVTVDASKGNVKLDLVDANTLVSSADMTLGIGINNGRLLGIDDLNLTGNGSANTLEGNRSANVIDGGGGNDVILAGAGDDVLNGWTGNDTLDGGDGIDTVDFSGFGSAITVSLLVTGAQTISVSAGQDSIVNVENLRGSQGGDHMTGTNGDNSIWGEVGNDFLYGQRGNDVIWGGNGFDQLRGNKGDDVLNGELGRDVLVGGDGMDTFQFSDMAHTIVGGHRDRIVDFLQGTDLIDIAAIDAITGGADDAFTLIGTDGFGTAGAGALRYFHQGVKTIIEGDVDGDNTRDFQIEMIGNFTLTDSDFLL